MLKQPTFVVILSAFGLALLATAPALADGDAAAGQKVYNKCKACHVLTGNGKRMGPTLECIFGSRAGAVEGYKYSKAMSGSDIIWTEETLEEFLRNPRKLFKGTKMSFGSLKDEQQMEDLLAYLEEATASAACPG